MSAILALEGNNTASTEAVENAGKQIILVTGSVLGGAVLSSSKTGNSTSTEVSWNIHILQTKLMCVCVCVRGWGGGGVGCFKPSGPYQGC